jgi:uncharacterized protein (TIGR01244 family)
MRSFFYNNFVKQALAVLFIFGFAGLAHAQQDENQGVRIRPVTSTFSVSAQMQVEDIKRAAEAGYTLVINNRPDGEGGPDQPTSAELAQAAREAGIAYEYIPFRSGHVTDEAFEKTKMTLASHEGKTVSFCRSGTRAITIWAMSQSASGKMAPEESIRAARGAGYDLGRQRARLNALAEEAKP